MRSTLNKQESGFTLVELAIALMIIGLLIGGVLKGIELVENARVTQITRNVKAFETAVTAFQSIYSALPGDIANPAARLPACTTSPCNTVGNGNGTIGTANTSGAYAADPADTSEERKFWLHLAVTGLISGVDSTGTSTGVVFGQAYPAAPVVGSGYLIQNIRLNAVAPYTNGRFSGHYLNLRAPGSADDDTIAALTGNQALQLDTKFDDGSPIAGDIFVTAGIAGAASIPCVASSNYVVDSDAKACSLYFKMTK